MRVPAGPTHHPPDPQPRGPFIVFGVVTGVAILLPFGLGLWLSAHFKRMAVEARDPPSTATDWGCKGTGPELQGRSAGWSTLTPSWGGGGG